MNKITFTLAVTLIICGNSLAIADTPQHGAFKNNSTTQVWHSTKNTWITPEQFWLDFANSRGGLTWPQSREYPPFSVVNEHDTFMVELDSGICLMEFFHSRWRRANDVRRWDDKFNSYSGCEKVFD